MNEMPPQRGRSSCHHGGEVESRLDEEFDEERMRMQLWGEDRLSLESEVEARHGGCLGLARESAVGGTE